MKMKLSFSILGLTRIAPLFIGAALGAAPLTWFPGPPLDTPISGAATTTLPGGANLLIGGDSYYYPFSSPLSLGATDTFWTYQPALYSVRVSPGAVANGDITVLYGGSDGTNSTDAVTGYSLSDGSLTLASMSVARSYLGYAPDGSGNAYALGGLDDSGAPLSSAEAYNQDSTNWAPIARLPTALYNFPAVFDGAGFIYAFGGRTNTTDGTETAKVLRYSVNANTWSTMAHMPVGVAGSAAALGADGKIYVVGGVSGGVTTNVVQVYDPAANSWVISTPLPEALSASAMGVDSLGRLILMGGMDPNGNDVGDVWRSQQLGVPDIAPIFTQYPVTNGGYQIPYTSTISASGNPQATFLVLSGPAGMQVDTYSGAITWTPQADQIGSNAVTIRATNYAGFADWSFTITVAPPPPIVPTNVAVVAVTDTSITLAWDPENPLCGPATYNIFEWRFTGGGKGGSHGAFFAVGGGYTNAIATIPGLVPGSTHAYAVNAVVGGYTTGKSAEAGATTTSPQTPPNVQLTGLTSTSLSLAWDASPGPAQNKNYSAVTGYAIEQFIPGGGGVPYRLVPELTGLTNTSGTVTGLGPGSSAFWTVQAFDAQGYGSSPLYYIQLITNPVPVAPVVSGGGVLANGNFQFTVQEAGPVVQTLVIQANTTLADPAGWVQITSILPGSAPFTFTDTNSAPYQTRFYRVLAP